MSSVSICQPGSSLSHSRNLKIYIFAIFTEPIAKPCASDTIPPQQL